MNKHNRMSRLLGRCVAGAFVFAAVAFGVCAQDTTTTTVRHGVKSYETEVKNAEVVYVEGNDLVLKLGSGKIEHLSVPDSDKFTINGSEVTVNELTPGTKLTQTITTTTAPRYVTTVRTLKGTVWHVNAHSSSVILRLPNDTNHIYRIPSHAKVMVAGKQKTVFDLKTGMKLEARSWWPVQNNPHPACPKPERSSRWLRFWAHWRLQCHWDLGLFDKPLRLNAHPMARPARYTRVGLRFRSLK
jgi:hypothetical protein